MDAPSATAGVSIPEIIVTSETPNHAADSSAAAAKSKLRKTCSSTPRNQRSFLYRSSSHIIGYIEWVCGLWGQLVASNPVKAILLSVFLVALSGSGLYYLTFEFRPYKLWVKEPSEFKEVHEWKMEKFPNTIRKHIAIFEMDNILTADAINQMWLLHQEVERSSSRNNIKYSDVCLRVPSLISQKQEEPSYDYENYQYEETFEVPKWIAKESESKQKHRKIVKKRDTDDSGTTVDEPNYEDYPYEEADAEVIENLSWLTAIMNQPQKDESHYISPRNASIQERKDHCRFVEELDLVCYEESLLEVWGYSDAIIKNLTDKQVLHDINEFRTSRVTGFPINISSYLGGVKKNRKGRIISAKASTYTWYTKVNMKAIRNCSYCRVEIDLGSGEEVDAESMEWEVHLTDVVDKFKLNGMPINLQASYLFGAVHRSALFEDFYWVCLGWILLIVYVVFTLGEPFSENSKIIPIFVGILCVAMSVMASYGICTVSGIPYGPLNTVLPILLIAIGVDDMYVIMNAWNSLAECGDDVVMRTRKTLNKAGLAVTVTSLTDVIAFVIGATTKVPALRYFCVYAAVGISVVYVLQVTLFVSSVVLNDKFRRGKNACSTTATCIAPDRDKSKNRLGKFMGIWMKFLLRPPVTAFVLLITGVYLGISVRQTFELQQKFESVWLLPKSSDIHRWFKKMDEIFPKDGREGFVFFEDVKLPEELPELQKLTENLRRNPYVSRVDAWFEKLLTFISEEDLFKNQTITADLFGDALSYFLYNEDGAKYRNDIIFDNKTEISCTNPAPPYTTFKINFKYIRMNYDIEGQTKAAMNTVREIVSNANLSGYRAPWALSYGQWETEDVISYELFRNVTVLLVIIFVMTMVLLASVRSALLVLICVLATLIDVAALMNFWGLTINTVSCIALVIAIGICVDYAAHITHGFLVAQGSRKFRAISALNHMGPAVLHGGLSTLIAFMLLGPSDTFVYLSYFKILTGVAVFGLYHALVLLPLLLALLGPPPYSTTDEVRKPADDSSSCITESSTFPDTNIVTPSESPQSTTPNSPSSNRNDQFPGHENPSFDHHEASHIEKSKDILRIRPSPKEQRKSIGKQALSNMRLHDSCKINMYVKGKQSNLTLQDRTRHCHIEKPTIKAENVLKLHISNS